MNNGERTVNISDKEGVNTPSHTIKSYAIGDAAYQMVGVTSTIGESEGERG